MMRSMALVLEEEPPAVSSKPARMMADSGSGDADDKPPARRVDRREKGGPEAFDIWLQRGLHQLYDSVAKEPIPDDLLKLIEQDRIDRSK